jgi:hypothetical protein
MLMLMLMLMLIMVVVVVVIHNNDTSVNMAEVLVKQELTGSGLCGKCIEAVEFGCLHVKF